MRSVPVPWRAIETEPQSGQRRRHPVAVAAVVAGEQVARAVQHERDVALRALPRAPARAAGEEVRPAAAVEQHDRLARVGDAPRACAGAARAPASRMSTISTGGSDAPSTRAGSRRRGSWCTLSGRGVADAGDEHRPGVARAPRGDAARVVARVALVLVAGVVLLVDDDQAEVGQRREDRRAGPHADPRRTAAQAHPLVVALAVGELGVQDGDGVAEARDEARHDLRGQRDLGDEHEHRPPLLERRARGVQVDLGLARAGHALQQQQRAGLGRGDRLQRGGLVGGQRRRLALGADRDVRRARGGPARASTATRPRASRRRSAGRSPPAKRGSVCSSARWRSVRRSPSSGRARSAPTARSSCACPSAAAAGSAPAPAWSSSRAPARARAPPAPASAARRGPAWARRARARWRRRSR